MSAQQPPPASPGFWELPIAGSIVTGAVAALAAIGVAVFTYSGTQRSLTRQLTAARDSWLRDHLLTEVSKYLAAARGLADQAFLVGATQVVLLERVGRAKEPGAMDPKVEATYRNLLDNDAALQREREELRKRQHEFSGLVHGVRLLLAPNFEIAEQLRARTDDFFGYSTHIRPDISNQEVHDRSDECMKLRKDLEKQVADLLGKSDLFADRKAGSTGAPPVPTGATTLAAKPVGKAAP